MIKPTVGRVVWYRPGKQDNIVQYEDGQPFAAVVAYVHSDRLVNLTVSDHNGSMQPRRSVRLQQEGDPEPAEGEGYCEWMPYQKGQAAKAEQLEKQVGA